ncbi:MAG: putative DNA binding domain-containing protein [Deferribacteraceae bacterium]|jgi:ATP-dependent DNA helicase RecG|nr:putative DNA binding domain-containing protein [Deferribacteraceae bacterium]
MPNNLPAILTEGESYTIEFKESPDKSLASEVCAFANASGGKIFIGVDDSGRIVGTDTSNAARSRIQDTINQIEPRLKVDIDIQENIIIVTVPEGTQKPYSCSKGFYLRSGPNSQKLERDSIIEFFQNEGRVRYDDIVREDLPIAERFNDAAYRRYIKLAKISEVLDRDTILKNLSCAALRNGKLHFTNVGALFFRVNDEDVVFRHASIVCALYKGVDKAIILDAKELNSDIVSNIDDAMIFLKKHLRMSYKIESLQRENILELPEDALREAVVNAVCHRDYFEKGARVMVEIYDDRVDITSPGSACKGITLENFGTVSITRNSIIASMLHRINYIEQMGTGIVRMKNATKEAKVAEPVFKLEGFFKTTFKRPTNRIQPDTTGYNRIQPDTTRYSR